MSGKRNKRRSNLHHMNIEARLRHDEKTTAKYVSLRGVESDTRPMGDLSPAEREHILVDYLDIGSAATREKWNISTRTLHHLKWHYRDILEKIEDERFQRFGL